MPTLKFLSILISCLLCLSCASGPAPRQQTRDVRDQTRSMNKGVTLYTKGCYAHALELFNEAHERYSVADDLEGEANTLNSIANTYFRLRDIDSALLIYDEALELYRFLDEGEGLIRTMMDKAAALIEAGRLDEASALLDQADAPASGVTGALRLKTRALLAMGREDIPEASKLLQRALAASQGVAPSVAASIHYALGHLSLMANEPDKALKSLQAALDLDRKSEAFADIAQDLQALAQCQMKLGHNKQALTYLKRCVKIHALLGNSSEVQAIVPELRRLESQTGVRVNATLHWINQWLAGKREFNVCR